MFSFTSTEKKQLFLGTSIFVLVELSRIIDPLTFLSNISTDLIILLFITGILSTPLFLFHELAHKFAAQGYGLFSQFRLFPNLALFSLLSIFLPVKIIAPGVVLSSGNHRSDMSARISMAGPLVNILLGGLFFFFAVFSTPDWAFVLLTVSIISYDLALFNLLPFSVFDGAKVIQWDKGVFALIFSFTLVVWLFHPYGIFWSFF